MIKILGLAVALAIAVAAQANAGQCGYQYCWGAVGIGPGGAHGYSYDHPSEAAALGAAQSGCKGNCTNIKTFYNTCGAMAQGRNSAWGFGWANSRGQAESNALGYCRQNGAGCQVSVWACSR